MSVGLSERFGLQPPSPADELRSFCAQSPPLKASGHRFETGYIESKSYKL